MTRTLTAYFDSVQAAEQAAYRLAEQVSSVRAQVFDARTGDTDLNAMSLPHDDIAVLREGIRRGGAAVYAEVPDHQFEAVAEALEASGAVDLDEREAVWRQDGWAGAPNHGTSQALGTTGMASEAGSVDVEAGRVQQLGAATSEERIPIVEENLRVGKREVEHGRVRIRSYVVETPVNEQVTLREEHVDVSRRSVDRPLTDADDAFRERVIEATEHAEEAVVSKEARVKEELVIRKDETQRTETVQDTVRRTEVKVEDDRTSGKGLGTADGAPDPTLGGASPKR
jgi:uncharacterized protein (TIGR02271 family)